MEPQKCLATLLDKYMKRASVGDARLASQVNSMMGNPYFIHRSTLRNWRDGSSHKVNSWRQLIVVAAALDLSKAEAIELLDCGHCPPMLALSATVLEHDQRLFNRWFKEPD